MQQQVQGRRQIGTIALQRGARASLHWYRMVPVYQSTEGKNILVPVWYRNTNSHQQPKGKGVYWYNSSDQQVSTNTNQTSGKQLATISQAKRQQTDNRTSKCKARAQLGTRLRLHTKQIA
jgi:hypothetical protein